HLERVPLKYEGLSYTEVWISESQERMVLAVPSAKWPQLQELCAGEDVEATVIGHFEATGRLRLHYRGQEVAGLDLHFLHEGRPRWTRRSATSSPSGPTRPASPSWTTSAGATRTGRRCSARWCGRPRPAATSPWPTACRSSAARTASRTSSTPPAGTSSSRRR